MTWPLIFKCQPVLAALIELLTVSLLQSTVYVLYRNGSIEINTEVGRIDLHTTKDDCNLVKESRKKMSRLYGTRADNLVTDHRHDLVVHVHFFYQTRVHIATALPHLISAKTKTVCCYFLF